MQRIPLALAMEGMVLARDVVNPSQSGSVPVCGKGLALTDGVLERLVHMGVESLYVEGHPVQIEGEGSLEEMLVALDKRFNRMMGDALTLKVRDAYYKYIQKSMGEVS